MGLRTSLTTVQVVTVGTPIPLNAILFSLVITIVLALINIGSSTAFNSIVALLNGAISFSYAVSVGCILFKRLRRQPLPSARFSLGKMGLPLNLLAFCFVIFSGMSMHATRSADMNWFADMRLYPGIITFFPVAVVPAVTPQTMNWGVVMFGGVFIIASIDFLVRGRKHYAGPVVHVKKY